MIDVARVHESARPGLVPFRYAETRGTPADHASWWSFDDEQSVRDRWWHPRKGETVLDIGAAFGSYAIPALAAGARVVCFNPAEFDAELLGVNLRLNPELDRRCLVLRDGLHSRDGWFDPDHCAFSSERKDGAPWLPVRALDSILEERPGIARVDWLKLDVEGAELEVLKGAEKCLRMYRPRVLVENHEFHDKDMPAKVAAYMAGLGIGYQHDGPVPHGSVSHSLYKVTP